MVLVILEGTYGMWPFLQEAKSTSPKVLNSEMTQAGIQHFENTARACNEVQMTHSSRPQSFQAASHYTSKDLP